MKNRGRIAAGIALPAFAVLLLLLTHLVPVRSSTMFWRGLMDFGHVPLFALMALLLLLASRAALVRRFPSWTTHLALAWCGAMVLGVSGEILQWLGPRDASPYDLLRDAAGATAALALAATRVRGRDRQHLVASPRTRSRLRWGALSLIAAALVPLGLWGLAYRHRAESMPFLSRFESQWERRFYSSRGVVLAWEPNPEGWERPSGQRVARLTFVPVRYPAVSLLEPFPDWRGFETLAFDLYSELDRPVALHLRIEDRKHDQSYEDRFNHLFSVLPGANTVRLPLSAVREAPEGREMDLSSMSRVSFFANHPEGRFTLYLDDLRLEGRTDEGGEEGISR